jgi:hypothetical protein
MGTIEEKEVEAQNQAVALRQEIDALQVVDRGSYELANAINKRAYDGKKAFHAWFDPIDDASKKQRQAVIAQGKKIDEPFDYAIKTTGDRSAKWMREEQARADAIRREAEAIARKKAEDEALANAQRLQDAGMSDLAETVLSAPVAVQKIFVPEPIKAEGVFYTDHFSAEVVDLLALVKAVAEGRQPISYLDANMTALNGVARSAKESANIDGVKIIKTTTQGRRS